jgi:hypothetical protein
MIRFLPPFEVEKGTFVNSGDTLFILDLFN